MTCAGIDCGTCATLRRAIIEASAAFGVANVDAQLLADVAGVPIDAVTQHGPGSVAGWIASAYAQATDGLQTEFENDFAAGSSWNDGLRLATDRLVSTLADDPARARFCYVEILRGDQRLRAQREAVRHRSIELFTRQYEARHGGGELPHVKLELACNSIIHVISTHAREGRVSELPDALDAMLLAAGAWETQAFT
jgi:hypothetical protein